MSDLARFLLDRIAEDQAPHIDAKASPQPGGEIDCPCGRRGELDGYSTTDGRLDGTLSITHVIGATPPVIIGSELVHSGGDAVTATHVLSYEQSSAIFDAMPMPARSRRVLAECAAKRAIVELHQDGAFTYPGDEDPLPSYCTVCHDYSSHNPARWPCATLLALAQPYSDHPDFNAAWATGGTPE